MNEPSLPAGPDREAGELRRTVGLCVDCASARPGASRRGSVFWRCARAQEDASYPRYPRLPVMRCPGFTARQGKP